MRFIQACAGPLANDCEALRIFTKVVLDADPTKFDSTAIYAPWRDVTLDAKKSLRLGVLPEDPSFPLHPSVKRIVSQSVEKLRRAGNQIVELNAAECHVAGINEAMWALFGLDQTGDQILERAGEPKTPAKVRIATELKGLGRKYLPDIASYDGLAKLSVLNKKRAEVTERWQQLWERYALDAVVGPASQGTAVEHDLYGVPGYTPFLNLLNVSFHDMRWLHPDMIMTADDV